MFTCDGLVPVAVFASSFALARIIQGQGVWDIIVCVGIPLSAFFVRYLMGQRSIQGNHCSAWTRWFQSAVMVIGLNIIAIIDCLLICISQLAPGNPPKGGVDKLLIFCCGFAVAYVAYMDCMAFAMYPGREPISPGENDHHHLEHDEW